MTALLALGMPNGIEWVVILFVVLILFGAKRLPELARGLGKSMSEFKKAREDFESELHQGAAEVSPTSVTVREPANRQLAYNPGGVSSGNVEQQVRELQEQLREMQRQNEALQRAATTTGGVVEATGSVPRVATPAPPAAPAMAAESTEPPQVSVKS